MLQFYSAALGWRWLPAGAIVGGTEDKGAHPEVGALVGPVPGFNIAYCSAVLVSPRVVVTAAHCAFGFRGNGHGVTFAEKQEAGAPAPHTGKLYQHPGFNRQANTPVNDVAVVVLDQPVPDSITPGQLPPAGLLDQLGLTPQSKFTTVGYGDTEFVNGPGGKTTTHVQARHYAVGSFRALTPGALHLSQNAATGDGGSCNGDSGGPNYIGAREPGDRRHRLDQHHGRHALQRHGRDPAARHPVGAELHQSPRGRSRVLLSDQHLGRRGLEPIVDRADL